MRLTSLPWSLRALIYAAIVAADSLPYNPTAVLRAPNSSYVYIFEPSTSSSYQGVLKSVDISLGLDISQVSSATLFSNLPFLQDTWLVPYTPIIDSSGNITVIAGSCTAGANKTEMWRFVPDPKDSNGNGTWTQHETVAQGIPAGLNLTGTNYLAGGVAFSPEAKENATDLGYYLFGGMCPLSNADDSNWVRDAAYANNMMAFTPAGNSSVGSLPYDITTVASRGPAIAEAGFTMTGLRPSYSVNSTGQPQSRQQDFLLLGGHTQTAFINMSNVALFSLPQQSWAFVPVDQPTGAKRNLAARESASKIEPRSGHSAVLSEDGASVIVLGGWVGDITTPAQPQLAVLHLGSEYGGVESLAWTWSVPGSKGNATTDGGGIYGHGAIMLPGGVMMIAGRYSISGSSSKRDEQTANTGIYLYNMTSQTWVDSYTLPEGYLSAADGTPSGPLSNTAQQAGLGVGLGVGTIALAGLICFYFWYARHLRKQREERARELLGGTSEVSIGQLNQPFLDKAGIDGRGGEAWAGEQNQQMMQAGSTGTFMSIPSPSRGLRKGLATRPYAYRPAPNAAGNGIHPIIEQSEDGSARNSQDRIEVVAAGGLGHMEDVWNHYPERQFQDIQHKPVLRLGGSIPIRDPFGDPEPNPLGSHPLSPSEPETVRRVPTGASRHVSPVRRPLSAEQDGSMNWMIIEHADDEPLDPFGSPHGRVSPNRSDDRTSSTLSERSQRSQASTNSITRTMSTRTGALLAAALAAQKGSEIHDTEPAPLLDERTSTMGTMTTGSAGRKSPYYFYNTNRPAANETNRASWYAHAPQKSADSFTTARTTFTQLQDEGQSLLGVRPMLDGDDPYQRALAATSPPTSPNMSGGLAGVPDAVPPGRRRLNWMGSLRRALTIISNSERSFSTTGSVVADQDVASPTEPRTSSSSPTRRIRGRKPFPQNPTSQAPTTSPRRAVSDGGALLLRQKRGQSDWEKETSYHDEDDWGEPREPRDDAEAEGEWDVEGAAEKRDVQVVGTFTVPKTRLRVVNADVERASLRSVSDSGPAGAMKKSRSRELLQARSSGREV